MPQRFGVSGTEWSSAERSFPSLQVSYLEDRTPAVENKDAYPCARKPGALSGMK